MDNSERDLRDRLEHVIQQDIDKHEEVHATEQVPDASDVAIQREPSTDINIEVTGMQFTLVNNAKSLLFSDRNIATYNGN